MTKDYRSKFVNRVCKLLYDKCNGDIDFATQEGQYLFIDFNEIIINFHELEKEIPLYYYDRLIKFGTKSFSFTEEEYNKEVIEE